MVHEQGKDAAIVVAAPKLSPAKLTGPQAQIIPDDLINGECYSAFNVLPLSSCKKNASSKENFKFQLVL